jgi:hypothetical protein
LRTFAQLLAPFGMRTPPCEPRAIPCQREYTGIAAPDWPGAGIPRKWSKSHRVKLLRLGNLAKLVSGAVFELADPLLGDPEFLAELIEGLLARPVQAEAAVIESTFYALNARCLPMSRCELKTRRWIKTATLSWPAPKPAATPSRWHRWPPEPPGR